MEVELASRGPSEDERAVPLLFPSRLGLNRVVDVRRQYLVSQKRSLAVGVRPWRSKRVRAS